jgi:hypothetical protein
VQCSEELSLTQDGTLAPFSFTGLPSTRRYKLQGWKDVNQNGTPDTGDLFGWYTETGSIASLTPGRGGLKLYLEPWISQQHLKTGGIFPPCR